MKCTDCNKPSTYIDHKGFIYCTKHGKKRQLTVDCRKLQPHELTRIKQGKPIICY